MAGEVGMIVRDLQRDLELPKPDANFFVLASSTISPGTSGGAFQYSAWTAAAANQYTTIALGAIDAAGDEMIVFLVGRTDVGDTSPRWLSAGTRDNVPGEFFWRWYKDPADGILYVRLWNGVEDLDIRAFYG